MPPQQPSQGQQKNDNGNGQTQTPVTVQQISAATNQVVATIAAIVDPTNQTHSASVIHQAELTVCAMLLDTGFTTNTDDFEAGIAAALEENGMTATPNGDQSAAVAAAAAVVNYDPSQNVWGERCLLEDCAHGILGVQQRAIELVDQKSRVMVSQQNPFEFAQGRYRGPDHSSKPAGRIGCFAVEQIRRERKYPPVKPVALN